MENNSIAHGPKCILEIWISLFPSLKKVKHLASEVVTINSTANGPKWKENWTIYKPQILPFNENTKITVRTPMATIPPTYNTFNLVRLVRVPGNSPVRLLHDHILEA